MKESKVQWFSQIAHMFVNYLWMYPGSHVSQHTALICECNSGHTSGPYISDAFINCCWCPSACLHQGISTTTEIITRDYPEPHGPLEWTAKWHLVSKMRCGPSTPTPLAGPTKRDHQLRGPVWDDILTPTIFWPQGQNIVTIYWPPLRYFDPPI